MATRYTQLYVGTSLATLAATVAGYFAGQLGVRDQLNFSSQNGTATGVVIQIEGSTAYQRFSVACTATGGLKKYPTCVAASPFTTTGALHDVAIDCGNTNVAMVMSGAFVKSNAATTEGTVVLKNVTVGSGAVRNKLSQTGSEILWNPADKIRLSTVTTQPNSASNCTMWVTARDKSGT